METLFIEAHKKTELDKEKLKEAEKLLPPAIYIAYSIQYKGLAEQVRKALDQSRKIEIKGFSQVLGCSEINTDYEILLIGEARFHALNLAISSGKEVYVFDNHTLSKINKEEIEKARKKEKGKYLRFLSAEELGVLVSTKPGQENLKLAEKIQEDTEKEKKAYLFLTDNINLMELENFTIPVYINTACPGLELDSSKIINIRTIQEYIKSDKS